MFAFSVIIPTHNRLECLCKGLLALARQDFPSEKFEVLVSDDGSTPPVAEQIAELELPFTLHVLRQEHGGPAAARNRALERARGQVILFLNDDALPEADLLSRHWRRHEERGFGNLAVLGAFPLLPEHARGPFGQVLDRTPALFGHCRLLDGHEYDYWHCCTGNSSVSRAAVLEVGMFDEDFRGPAAEDIELGYRLEQAGCRLLYAADCLAWHDHAIAPTDFCRINELRGTWAPLLFCKHPDLPARPRLTPERHASWARRVARAKGRVRHMLVEVTQLAASDTLSPEEQTRFMGMVEELHQHHYLAGLLQSPYLAQLLRLDRTPLPTDMTYDLEQRRSLAC